MNPEDQARLDAILRRNPDFKGTDLNPGAEIPEGWAIPSEPESKLSQDALFLQRYLEGRHDPLSDEELEHWIKAAPAVLMARHNRYEADYAKYLERKRDYENASKEDVNRRPWMHWLPSSPSRPKHWEPLAWALTRIVEGYRPDGARADATSPCHCPYCLSVPERRARYDEWMAADRADPKWASNWPVPDDAV